MRIRDILGNAVGIGLVLGTAIAWVVIGLASIVEHAVTIITGVAP